VQPLRIPQEHCRTPSGGAVYPYRGAPLSVPPRGRSPGIHILREVARAWSPGFLDYLFLAFNTSTAFSLTDTAVLSGKAKALMMMQALLSLVILAVLVSRAINAIAAA
jgi:hypothetical protein